MSVSDKTILLIGESAVGKSHYGGQLLKRLMQEDGKIRMDGAATNLEPFEAVVASLDKGVAAGHTATATYQESRWPIVDDRGRKANLIWPDYGGEQIKKIIDERRLPYAWLHRIGHSSAWLLLIRLQKTRTEDDIFSRPLRFLKENSRETENERVSDQARLIELLQILAFAWSSSYDRRTAPPRLVVLLTCWDEMEGPETPWSAFRERLPMFSDYVASNWERCAVLGLSALGRSLDRQEPDEEYVNKGSERFGYVVLENGDRSSDLTLPIRALIAGPARA